MAWIKMRKNRPGSGHPFFVGSFNGKKITALFTQHPKADLRANPLMLLAICVNTPIDHSVFHNLLMPVARCSVSCVNGA